MKRRVPALLAALALFALLIPFTTSVVFAWSAPSIASVCSNDQAVHNWTVTLSGPSSDFGTNDIEWADNSGFSGATSVTMVAGDNSLSTPSSVTTLYVRWSADHGSNSSATWNGGACSTPPPTGTPFQSFEGATATPTLDPQTVQLTLIKVLCPSYSVVPANSNPTNVDQTGGHGGELDTSYQTTLVNPSTDIPQACSLANGWQFQLYGDPNLTTPVGSPLTTGSDGTGAVTITLDSTELALAQTGGAPTGLWVAEIEQPSVATFGALRCYTDILNGDNVENIRDIGTDNVHAYCIAYNVVVPVVTEPPATSSPCVVGIIQPEAVVTPNPCATPVVTPTIEVTAPPLVTSSPFQSFQGETATPTTPATDTPFQSFQGATAVAGQTTTPPPTNTDGNGSGNNSTPLFAVLISLAFGGLGLAAVESQRRTIRR